MKKVSLVALIVVIFSLVLVSSCESNTYSEVESISENPTYSNTIQPIMTENCTSCHANNSQYPNLETFAEVKEACQNGNVVCRIDTQSCGSVMPQSGRMTESKIASIKLWIAQGYSNQ